MEKKKLSDETKIKLVYSVELLVIALVLIVIGVLKYANAIVTKPTRLFVYNILSACCGVWMVAEFIWAMVSPKKRAKTPMLDKIMMLPIGIYILCFDTICFTRKALGLEPLEIYIRYSVGTVLTVIGLVYIFQAVYHYYHPVPQVIEAIEETKKARLEEEQKALETQEKSEEKSEEENEKA